MPDSTPHQRENQIIAVRNLIDAVNTHETAIILLLKPLYEIIGAALQDEKVKADCLSVESLYFFQLPYYLLISENLGKIRPLLLILSKTFFRSYPIAVLTVESLIDYHPLQCLGILCPRAKAGIHSL